MLLEVVKYSQKYGYDRDRMFLDNGGRELEDLKRITVVPGLEFTIHFHKNLSSIFTVLSRCGVEITRIVSFDHHPIDIGTISGTDIYGYGVIMGKFI